MSEEIVFWILLPVVLALTVWLPWFGYQIHIADSTEDETDNYPDNYPWF